MAWRVRVCFSARIFHSQTLLVFKFYRLYFISLESQIGGGNLLIPAEDLLVWQRNYKIPNVNVV